MKILNLILLLAVFAVSISLITVRDEMRTTFNTLTQAEIRVRKMNEEYEVLLVRQAELSNVNRVKKIAEEKGLYLPKMADVTLIRVGQHANTE